MNTTNNKEPQTATIDTTLLDCSICLNILVEPISIPCGHTFCRTCLVTTQQKTQKKCPLCRAVCSIDASTQKENILISNILKSCLPSQYNHRLKEVECQKKEWKQILPVFFFNDVLFPSSILRLHLFEPRYKLMIRRVLEGNRCFAYVPNFKDYRASKGEIGLVANVVECQFLHDGRALLEAVITNRFKIIDHWVEEGTNNLNYCKYEEIIDEIESDGDEISLLHQKGQAVVDKFKGAIDGDPIRQFSLKQVLGEFPSERSTPSAVCWWLISVMSKIGDSMSNDEKMELLCSPSLKWRYKFIIDKVDQIFVNNENYL